MLRVIKHRSGGDHRQLQSAWRETCSNNPVPSGFLIRDTSILEPTPCRAPVGPTRLHSPLRWVLVQPASLDDWWAGSGAHRQPVHGVQWENRNQEAAGQG